jgi:transcriptional regulator with XRE-family HTH domain
LRESSSEELTQKEFAEYIGVAGNTISRLECGTIGLTSHVAWDIVAVFDITFSWLLGFSEDMHHPRREEELPKAIRAIYADAEIPENIFNHEQTICLSPHTI